MALLAVLVGSCSSGDRGGAELVTLDLAVTGGGAVEIAPAGIRCTERCQIRVGKGRQVRLLATGGRGATFVRWKAPCGQERACELMLHQDIEVTASFSESPYAAAWVASVEPHSLTNLHYWHLMVDQTGDAILAGMFADRLVVGRTVDLQAVGRSSGYVARFAARDGRVVWAHAFGSTGDDLIGGLEPTDSGDVLALVAYSWYARGWQLGSEWLHGSNGGAIALLSRSAGEPAWVHPMPGQVAAAVRTQERRLIVAAREFDLDSPPPAPTVVFVLDEDREVIWHRQLDPSIAVRFVLAHEDLVVVAGFAIREDRQDLFVTALAVEDGLERWTRRVPAASPYRERNSVRRLAISAEGELILAGTFGGRLELDGRAIESAGGSDIFLAGLAPEDGSCRWLRRIGGSGREALEDLASGPSGLFVVAMTTEEFEHEGVALGAEPEDRDGPSGVRFFLIRLRPDGTGATPILASADMEGGRIAVDPWNNLILSGLFRGPRSNRATIDILGKTVPVFGAISVLKLEPNVPVAGDFVGDRRGGARSPRARPPGVVRPPARSPAVDGEQDAGAPGAVGDRDDGGDVLR